MVARVPQIVGIAGGSCAGKSWLADRLRQVFGKSAARLSLDDFYIDRSHLPMGRRGRVNFDHPRAVDWERLEEALERFANGVAADVPRYDFATHGRLHEEGLLEPAPLLIVEGLWLFRRASLRERFTLKVYIRSTSELCTQRRLSRDTVERGRTREQVLEQLRRYTLPSFQRFVAPQERWADLVLEAPISEQEVQDLTDRIAANISNMAVGI